MLLVKMLKKSIAIEICISLALTILIMDAPNAKAQPIEKDMIFFLHYVNATEIAKSLPGGGSTLTYFDTTHDWNDENVTISVAAADVYFDWYLCPPLAGEFTTTAFEFKIWARFVSGAAPTGNVEIIIAELNETGVESWTESFPLGSDTFSRTPELKTYSGIFSSPHTFSSGSSIKVQFRFNPGVGKTFEFYYDTAQVDSRVEFQSANSMKIENVRTLDYNYNSRTGFDPTVDNKTIYIRTNVTDPFGGYDIKWVNITLESPTGTLIFDNSSMTKIYDQNIRYAIELR